MIKHLLIPLVVFGGEPRGELLELYIEPRCFKPRSCFDALRSAGLDAGLALAQDASQRLGLQAGRGMIYVAGPQPFLSNSKGAAAGLVLASLMAGSACRYSTLIVSAELSPEKGGYDLRYNGFWNEKLTTMLTLPVQAQVTPLILAEETPLSGTQKALLAACNIRPYLFGSLAEAVELCRQGAVGRAARAKWG